MYANLYADSVSACLSVFFFQCGITSFKFYYDVWSTHANISLYTYTNIHYSMLCISTLNFTLCV